MNRIHPQAKKTPRTRAEIKASASPLSELVERYNITVATARKWKKRETTRDLSYRPHNLSTTLTAGEEARTISSCTIPLTQTGPSYRNSWLEKAEQVNEGAVTGKLGDIGRRSASR